MLKPNRATKGKILTTPAQFWGGIPTNKANFSSQEKLDWWLLFITVKAKAKSGYKRGDLAHDKRPKAKSGYKGGGEGVMTKKVEDPFDLQKFIPQIIEDPLDIESWRPFWD